MRVREGWHLQRDGLDERFGPAVSPRGSPRAQEVLHPLGHHRILDQETATQLEDAARLAGRDGIFELALPNFLFLWAVDEWGAIRVGLEVVSFEPEGEIRPRVKGVSMRLGSGQVGAPLGHPTLVGLGRARIAGELYLDIDRASGHTGWVLNNKSGRYSTHPSRRPAHLDEVGRIFASFGIPVYLQYRP